MTRKVFLAGVLLAAALLVTMVLVDFDSPELGQAVLQTASEATGVQLDASAFRFNVLRGLILEGVEAQGESASGTYKLTLNQLIFEHRLTPLLSGTVAVERIVLDEPRIELLETSSPGGVTTPSASSADSQPGVAGGSEKGASSGLALEVGRIALHDGSITFRTAGTDGRDSGSTIINGLELDLRDLAFDPDAPSPLLALKAAGNIEIGEVLLDDEMRVRNASGNLGIVDGRFEIQELSFTADPGAFLARLLVDFNQSPFEYQLDLKGDPLDLNRMASSGDEGQFGAGHLKLDARGSGPDTRKVDGQGVLDLEAGTLPSTPILSGMEQALGRTALVGSKYKATSAPFQISNNRFSFQAFSLETEQAAIDLSGWADLDGPLALNVVIRTPREGLQINEIRDEVLDALTTDDGWVALPYRVTGSLEEPTVSPDAQALAAQAKKGATRVVTQKATERLKGLLGR